MKRTGAGGNAVSLCRGRGSWLGGEKMVWKIEGNLRPWTDANEMQRGEYDLGLRGAYFGTEPGNFLGGPIRARVDLRGFRPSGGGVTIVLTKLRGS